ncbi:MAG: hypothetical protein R3E54_10105 [Halioglobus sp.]
MTRLAAILVLVIWAQAAQARDGGESLLRCGVLLGGAELAYRPASDAARRASRVNLRHWRADSVGAPRTVAGLFPESAFENAFVTSQSRSRSRLPAVLTIARIGCTWR